MIDSRRRPGSRRLQRLARLVRDQQQLARILAETGRRGEAIAARRIADELAQLQLDQAAIADPRSDVLTWPRLEPAA